MQKEVEFLRNGKMRFPERFFYRINGTELEEVVGRPARHHGLAGSRARVELKAAGC